MKDHPQCLVRLIAVLQLNSPIRSSSQRFVVWMVTSISLYVIMLTSI